MPRYWLCILTPENYEVVKEKLVWGVTDRHRKKLLQVKKGDKLVMYVIREKKIKGIFEAVSDPYVDEKEIFSGGVYPNRVKLKPVKLSDDGVDILELVPKLDVFKRKDNKWVGTIVGKAMVELSEKDYKMIEERLTRSEETR